MQNIPPSQSSLRKVPLLEELEFVQVKVWCEWSGLMVVVGALMEFWGAAGGQGGGLCVPAGSALTPLVFHPSCLLLLWVQNKINPTLPSLKYHWVLQSHIIVYNYHILTLKYFPD